jgi:pimeloyl-ACP methyl ester carboxylesterase
MPVADQSGLAPVNGIRLYYAIFGKGLGNPVLLLHGGFTNSEYWGFEVPLLSKSHQVIVVDSRGHGRSTMDGNPFSYELMTDDILQLLDYLNIKKVTIIGWSDGGIIGLIMAIHHPERLNRLFTFGANFNLAGYKSEEPDSAQAALFMARVQADYRRLSPEPDSFYRLRKALAKMYSIQPDIDTSDLKKIHTPTIISAGEYDQFIKREHFEEMARLIPGSRLVIMQGVNHGGLLQDPVAFHREVMKFLKSP